jgi:hypothetical protein
MPVNATRLVSKMRGGAQAHMFQADDGNCYITKFRCNPQHRRILINEMLASSLLEYLQISCPPVTIVNVSADLLAREHDVFIQLGTRRQPVGPGWHFGSKYPLHPDRLAVYDYLPDTLLGKTVNLREFLGVLVFDKWVANADARQAIFFRSRVRDWVDNPEIAPQQKGFVTLMVDHGYILSGPQWDFPDSPLQGLYFRHMVYHTVEGLEAFEPWLDRVVHLPERIIDEAWRKIPRPWLEDDEGNLERVLQRLLERRKRVPDLLNACKSARPNPFPNWK